MAGKGVAPIVKLFEHSDFAQAILRAAEHFAAQGFRPAIIEKDYYVTEVLRIVAATAGERARMAGACA